MKTLFAIILSILSLFVSTCDAQSLKEKTGATTLWNAVATQLGVEPTQMTVKQFRDYTTAYASKNGLVYDKSGSKNIAILNYVPVENVQHSSSNELVNDLFQTDEPVKFYTTFNSGEVSVMSVPVKALVLDTVEFVRGIQPMVGDTVKWNGGKRYQLLRDGNWYAINHRDVEKVIVTKCGDNPLSIEPIDEQSKFYLKLVEGEAAVVNKKTKYPVSAHIKNAAENILIALGNACKIHPSKQGMRTGKPKRYKRK